MCFSAPASFIASGGLAVVGGATFVMAQKKEKILAVIPILFAIQQGIEGIQWIYLNNGSSSLFAGYGFLFFAFLVWPVYVPIFVYILEKKKKRQSILKWFIVLGGAVSLYLLGILLTQSLHIQELRACVDYDLNVPFSHYISTAYLVAVFGPLFATSRVYFKWFGIVIALFALVSWLFFTLDFISVWCFFAAIVSFMFFMYIRYRGKLE